MEVLVVVGPAVNWTVKTTRDGVKDIGANALRDSDGVFLSAAATEAARTMKHSEGRAGSRRPVTLERA